MDGEILISLQKQHAPTAQLTAMLRRELPQRFPALQFFFQPADIVDQVLNFGQPAPIDIRVTGSDTASTYALAQRLTRQIARVPGVVDAHVFQVPDAPALSVDVDRALATQVGLTQRDAASNVLVSTNSSAQTAPNFWVDPSNGVSYPLVVQQPTYDISSSQDLKVMPVSTLRGQRPVAAADEPRGARPRTGAAGDLAAEHPAGVRRARQRAGPRPVLDVAGHRPA